ncbi:MAG: asparagine synthase (glutamine-hydrolyzing) [Blastocatellia bacterium]
MCGIVGVATRRGREEAIVAVQRGLQALGHRGPDDEGWTLITDGSEGRGGADWTVCFGHRRLSILDPTPAGHQPMQDSAKGDWITYNGEVFNHQHLRETLVTKGVRFHSRTDTEVVLKSFGRDGGRALRTWHGMFAFGFWEAAAERLSLVRDRLGIKPLYYYRSNESFVFGSEVRALLATGLVPRRLSGRAVEQFLAYGSVEAPLTIVEGIQAVLPGQCVEFLRGEVREESYWKPVPQEAERAAPADASLVEEVRDLALDAVRLWRVSDVPISLFLSGGIDSGALLSLLHQSSDEPIHSFCLRFEGEGTDEGAVAETVARHYGAVHRTVTRTEEEARTRLKRAVAALDQPSIDGINTWFLSEAVSEAGFKVALSGLGGDEGFLGYGFFQTLQRDERWRRRGEMVPGVIREGLAALLARLPLGRTAKLEALLRGEAAGIPMVRFHRQLFTSTQRRQLLGEGRSGPEASSWIDDLATEWGEADPINLASAIEMSGYLPNTLLRDTDTMSMAHGLEVRVPFLDHRLIERLLELPGSVKLRPGAAKWLLVAAARDLPEIVTQRRKQGFELPFDRWLREALREEMMESLGSKTWEGWLDRRAANQVWEGFLARRLSWSRVWALYVLREWIERHLSPGQSAIEGPVR